MRVPACKADWRWTWNLRQVDWRRTWNIRPSLAWTPSKVGGSGRCTWNFTPRWRRRIPVRPIRSRPSMFGGPGRWSRYVRHLRARIHVVHYVRNVRNVHVPGHIHLCRMARSRLLPRSFRRARSRLLPRSFRKARSRPQLNSYPLLWCARYLPVWKSKGSVIRSVPPLRHNNNLSGVVWRHDCKGRSRTVLQASWVRLGPKHRR